MSLSAFSLPKQAQRKSMAKRNAATRSSRAALLRAGRPLFEKAVQNNRRVCLKAFWFFFSKKNIIITKLTLKGERYGRICTFAFTQRIQLA